VTMQIDIEPAGPCKKRVKVTIPPERVSEEFDKSYKNLVRTVPIPGFRSGKAPRKLVEKRFGPQVVDEVRHALFDAAFEEALQKKQLAPIADPELDLHDVEVEPTKQVAFDFVVTVKPEFDLPDLGEIEVKGADVEPTAEELDLALLALRKRKATLRPVESAVEDGDVVSLHLHGFVDGKEVFHEEGTAYEVGSRYLGGLVADGLDEALRRKKAGAKVKAKAFPLPSEEDHPLAGVVADVEAEVLDVKRPDLPPVDESFAKFWDFESVDALRTAVRGDVRSRKERDRDRFVEDQALAQLLDKVKFDLPKELIDREVAEGARRLAYEMQLRKEPQEEIAKRVAELRERRSERAALELKAFFLLDRLVEKERILVTETEVREAIAVLAAYNEKSPEQMYAVLRESGRLATLRNQLKERKARARLRARVKVVDVPGGGGGGAPAAAAADEAPAKKPKKKSRKE